MKTKAGPNSSGKKTSLYGGFGGMLQAQNIVSKPMFSLNFSYQLTHAICHKKGDGSEIKAGFSASCWHLR